MLLFLMVALTACSSGSGEPTAQESSNGALAFQAVWPQPARDVAESTENTPDVCTTFGIETITALVVDMDGVERGTGSWPCDTQDHKGTIDGLPVGAGYRVVVQGLIGSDEAWHGNATNVTINAGQTTTIEKIVMHSLDFVLSASTSDGGRIEPSGSIPASAISVQTFTFIPRSGYELDDVIVDGASLGFMESYTFSNIDASHSIYVSFTPTGTTTTSHTITASAGGGGAIVPDGQVDVTEGNDQTFNFQPAAGNHVADVFVDGVSQGALPSYTFRDVTAAHTIRVAFDTTIYTINASAGPGGSIDPAGDITAAHGSTPSFTITADAGFYLASLRIDGADVPTRSTYTFPAVSDNATIEATFMPVRYVDADATAGGNGTTWQSAFQTLTDAIQAAADGDEIWIKAGTYPLSNQVSVNKAVAIHGGHTGTEIFAHQRNWQDNPVIFDGRGTTRAFFFSANARMDGIIVQDFTLGTGIYPMDGGALYIDHCSPTFTNCVFRNNSVAGNACTGGAVHADNSSPIFRNCRFEGNYVYCELSRGGAVFLNACDTTISGCTFNNNWIGMSMQSIGASLVIDRGTIVISDSQFTGNNMDGESSMGGAIASVNAGLTVSGCRFSKNSSRCSTYCYGGAVYHDGRQGAPDPVISNSIFLENSVGRENSNGESRGGALFNSSAAPSILNCTFSGNYTSAGFTSTGGAISNYQGNPTITNTILWGNHAYINDGSSISNGPGMQLYDDNGSASTVSFSVIDETVSNGHDNIRQAPTLDVFGHLQPGSVGLDAGDDATAPATDIDGEIRPSGGRSDIGADELVDDDGDRIPDYWERHYGLDTAMDDSAEDPDGDGLSNLVEYQLGLDPTDANTAVAAQHRGWYDENGRHVAEENDTRCGAEYDVEFRSYFTFELPAVSGTVVGAVLRLELVSYSSIRATETFSAHDVTTDVTALEASGTGQTAIFNDLGDGRTYADENSISPADVGTIIGIALSAAAVEDIRNSLGNSFAVGIRPTSPSADESDTFTFSEASENRTHQLVLIVEE